MDERIIGKWEKEEFGEIINIISINPPKMKMSIRITGYFNIEPNCAYEKDGYFCYEIMVDEIKVGKKDWVEKCKFD